MNDLFFCRDEMVKNWRSLRSTWDASRDSWKDIDRDQFEREHVQEISQTMNAYIANLGRFAETVQHIMNEAP